MCFVLWLQGEFPACKDRSFTLGHEFSGVVHEVGKDVFLKKGEHVVVDPNRYAYDDF